MVASTHGHLLSVGQEDAKIARGLSAHFLHVFQIDDRGAMNPHEHLRIQLAFNSRHGLAKQVAFSCGTYANVILFSGNPSNFGDGQEQYASARFENNASRMRGCGGGRPRILRSPGCAVADPLARKLQRRTETFRREWLEKIVGRAHFKCAHRILAVRRGNDNVRQRNALVPGELRHDIEAILRGHTDIEEQQVRLFHLHLCHDFRGRSRLSYDLNARLLAEQDTELLPCESFIVCDNRLYGHGTSSFWLREWRNG